MVNMSKTASNKKLGKNFVAKNISKIFAVTIFLDNAVTLLQICN